MTEHERHMRKLATLAVENGECGAQLEIKDAELRRALIDAIITQLWRAYQLGAIA